jgi:hypothetical protein
MGPAPAHVFDVRSAALAACLFLVSTAFVAATTSSEHNHSKGHSGVVPCDWFPSVKPLHPNKQNKSTSQKPTNTSKNSITRDKNAGQGLHLFEESKVIKINRSEALPTESLQSRV